MSAYPTSAEEAFRPVDEHVAELKKEIQSDRLMSMPHDDVEAVLKVRAREFVSRLLQSHLDLRAIGEEERESPTGADEKTRTHRRHNQTRPLATIFGLNNVHRLNFTSPDAVGGLRPLDAELNLPVEKYSFGLRREVAEFAIDLSFDKTVDKVANMTGTSIPKRQVEELVVRAARDFDEFYAGRQQVLLEAEPPNTDNLLVLSSDGKGIVMRTNALREQTRKKAESRQNKLATRLSQGEKRNRKRMAEVASVYDLKPQVRTVDDIMPIPNDQGNSGEKPRRKPRPRAQNKRVWASVEKPLKAVVEECFEEALARDPMMVRTWVYLVDGNKDQLRAAEALARIYGVVLFVVIDFIHVLEYLWKAAWCFFEKGDKAVESWVLKHARSILEGKASTVAGAIRRSATKRGLSKKERKGADDCAKYLMNNKERLRYDEYLARGMPIATGVIEGACRYLVNDRMGITGARWGLEGAEAVLRLRALRSSGDFEEYCDFHRQKELERNHLSNYADTELSHLRLAA